MLKAQFALTNLVEDLRMRLEDETGAIPVEYLGILIFAAAIVVAIIGLNLDTTIKNAVQRSVESVTNKAPGG